MVFVLLAYVLEPAAECVPADSKCPDWQRYTEYLGDMAIFFPVWLCTPLALLIAREIIRERTARPS